MKDRARTIILVVDDSPENVTLLSRILKMNGYDIQVADNGAQAIESAKKWLPDLILLDINMPVMDGFEACARLNADERTRGIPVIFISALDNLEDKVKAFQSGGVDYILKPFEYEEIQARVETHLVIRRLRVQLEEANQQLAARVVELTRLNNEIQRLANEDVLTGCFNRRHFMEVATQEIQRSRRYKHSLSFLMLDIDHFKGFNDRYGHQVGDQLLCHLVSLCQDQLRTADTLGRYGGEEFVALMPETDRDGAWDVSERLRAEIEKMKINTLEGKLSITVSMGLTSLESGFDETQTLDTLIRSADKALFAAKDAGRNCIQTA